MHLLRLLRRPVVGADSNYLMLMEGY
jgi:hypothetical protein